MGAADGGPAPRAVDREAELVSIHVHRSGKPLAEFTAEDLSPTDPLQADLFGGGYVDECEGMCGV